MSKIYSHENHPHQPMALTSHDAREHMRARGGLNTAIAVALTKRVGSMWTAYFFAVLAIIGLLGVVGLLSPVAYTLVAWTSQTFIQLVMLPIIMVGQAVLGKQQELQSEETAKTTQKSYHQIGQIVKHLNAQDEAIVTLNGNVERLTDLVGALDLKLASTAKSMQALQKKASGV